MKRRRRARREQIAREAEFYGAMDWRSSVQSARRHLATILITAINIVAGFLDWRFFSSTFHFERL